MKFCGLISGGKDSIYAIQVATSIYGYTLVCGAHMSPPKDVDELDSYMFQSAASNVVPLLCTECLGVPVVIYTTQGRTTNTRLVYDSMDNSDEEEEVEDLYMLLSHVKTLYPDVTAVCCGAILSNYQRTRFEHVCGRLQLTPIAFLWRKAPQASLLDEMISSGNINAVLVKTAYSMGLSSRKHLHRSLHDLRALFETLEKRYSFHACGEGGEYESLVLDCPIYQKKLILDQVQTVHDHDDPMEAAYLKILEFHTEWKTGSGHNKNNTNTPPIHHVVALVTHDKSSHLNDDVTATVQTHQQPTSSGGDVVASPGFHHQHGGLIQVSQLISIGSNTDSVHQTSSLSTNLDMAAISEFQCITKQLTVILKETHCSARDVVMVHLYLSRISLFACINVHYVAFFGSVMPPSRVCVAVGVLSGGRNVSMDCTIQSQSGAFLRGTTTTNSSSSSMAITGDSNLRQVLHVQSRSCWAPSCVGPYSQANTIRDGIVYLAGQVGLIPATMELASSKSHNASGDNSTLSSLWEEELMQCWKNTASVLDAMGDSSTCKAGQFLGQALGGIVYISTRVLQQNDDDNSTSTNALLWNKVYNLSNKAMCNNAGIIPGQIDGYHLVLQRQTQDQQDCYEDEETRLADTAVSKDIANNNDSSLVDNNKYDMPLLFIAIPELPVGASAEVELICISSKAASCLQLESTSFHTTLSQQQQRRHVDYDSNNVILSQAGLNPTKVTTSIAGITTAATTTTTDDDDDDVLMVTTTMNYVKGCCAVACIAVNNKTIGARQQQDDSSLVVLNIGLILREIMNHIQRVATISYMFVPAHLSRIRLHFTPEAGGDGTSLQSILQSELTRLVVQQQQTRCSINSNSIPAVSIVPVKAIANEGMFSAIVEVLDLVHMETEMCKKHKRTS